MIKLSLREGLCLVTALVAWSEFLMLIFCLFYVRKVAEDGDNDNDEETKRNKMVI